MTKKNVLTTIVTGLLLSTLSYGQTDSSKSIQPEKMQTLFSKANKKLNYLGASFGSEIVYGGLAGEFTPMSGGSAMLHFNKTLGIGLAGYGTVDRNFAPTALSSTNLLALRNGYGGLKLEYTPKPNAAIHVSFPLLIGGGMASVDSLGNKGFWGRGRGGRSGRGFDNFGYSNNNSTNISYFIIQPGINVEANVFRFVKIFAGASYRLATSVTTQSNGTTTALPAPTAGQLSGLNATAGMKIGIFDYYLHRTKTAKRNKAPRESSPRRSFFGRQ